MLTPIQTVGEVAKFGVVLSGVDYVPEDSNKHRSGCFVTHVGCLMSSFTSMLISRLSYATGFASNTRARESTGFAQNDDAAFPCDVAFHHVLDRVSQRVAISV